MYFFFFQAEDGIRDLYVTGVQTCALPICVRPRAKPATRPLRPSTRKPGRLGRKCMMHEVRGKEHAMPTVSVRYIVNDVDEAIAFYSEHLGFHEELGVPVKIRSQGSQPSSKSSG